MSIPSQNSGRETEGHTVLILFYETTLLSPGLKEFMEIICGDNFDLFVGNIFDNKFVHVQKM